MAFGPMGPPVRCWHYQPHSGPGRPAGGVPSWAPGVRGGGRSAGVLQSRGHTAYREQQQPMQLLIAGGPVPGLRSRVIV